MSLLVSPVDRYMPRVAAFAFDVCRFCQNSNYYMQKRVFFCLFWLETEKNQQKLAPDKMDFVRSKLTFLCKISKFSSQKFKFYALIPFNPRFKLINTINKSKIEKFNWFLRKKNCRLLFYRFCRFTGFQKTNRGQPWYSSFLMTRPSQKIMT